ncbi:MAG: hypothetical protein VX028_02365 [Nanoarchaeota archaeon]|nr:hypothetical protein [Nanoarchaeota archaeon]
MTKNNFSILKLKKNQVKHLLETLSTYYQCETKELNSKYFYTTPKGKVYICEENIAVLENQQNIHPNEITFPRINSIGMYFGTYHDEERFRLSIEGSALLDPKANFIELKDENALKSYISAENITKEEVSNYDHSNHCPFLIVRYNGNSIGSVSPKEGMFINYVPKSRKLEYSKLF